MRSIRSRRSQQGVVLYVALIMLLLLSLLGIVAMQVATLQERMASNYQSTALAFQRAEARARASETQLQGDVDGGTIPSTNVSINDCTPWDAAGWTGAASYVRRLDKCYPQSGKDYPADESEATDQIYQVTAYDTDGAGNSQAVVDTVFIP